ncbi:MAG: hypothetical protein Q8R47_03675 [Nanoarchaeota archaeon]|nr:hypothetical protein [Nanoarchaeota archaeon]
MKKGLYAALFSATLASCAPRYAPPPDLPSSIKQISKPQEAQQWLENVLIYKRDPVLYGEPDFWAPCALTYQLKAGDCEDYAICAAALLDKDIQQGYLIYIDNPSKKDYNNPDKPESAHAMFAYRLHNKWGILSNNHSEFRLPEYSTLRSAVQNSLGRKYSRYVIYDYSGVDMINGNKDLEPEMKEVGQGTLK